MELTVSKRNQSPINGPSSKNGMGKVYTGNSNRNNSKKPPRCVPPLSDFGKPASVGPKSIDLYDLRLNNIHPQTDRR